MENGVQFEHTHRLVATAVGLATIALAVLLHRRRAADPLGAVLGWTALGLVCVQGGLGGVTVLMRLPLLVTMAHLATSMVFFCVTVLIAARVTMGGATRLPPRQLPPSPPPETGHAGFLLEREGEDPALAQLRPWAGVVVGVTFVQILLGGLVRHTASGLACFGIPLCNGELWPAQAGAHLHMTHRMLALFVAALVVALAVAVLRRARRVPGGSRVARLAVAAMGLVAVQIGLGVLSVFSLLALAPVTLHLGVAALLLVCNVALFYYLPARVRAPESVQIGEAARAW